MDKVYDIVDNKIVFITNGQRFEVDLRSFIWPCSAFSVFYLLFFKKTGFEDVTSFKRLQCQQEDNELEDDNPYSPETSVVRF